MWIESRGQQKPAQNMETAKLPLRSESSFLGWSQAFQECNEFRAATVNLPAWQRLGYYDGVFCVCLVVWSIMNSSVSTSERCRD